MLATVCQSDAETTAEAVVQLIEMADVKLDGAVPRAGLLFASTAYDHALLLAELDDHWPGLALIGGTTDGEFSSAGGLCQDSAVLVLLAGDGFEAHVGVGSGLGQDQGRAVAEATASLPADADVWLTVFAPSSDAAAVVRELEGRRDRLTNASRDAHGCPIVGGLSGDHAEFSSMHEFCGRSVNTDSVAVMALSGDVRVGLGMGAGWFPLGRSWTVTAASGPIVTTISDRPAIEVYREHWGSVPTPESLGAYPFAVYPDGLDGSHFMRAVLGADHRTGALRFAGEVPEGSVIRMTEVLPEGVLAGSAAAVRAAVSAFEGGVPQLALVVSCAARKWVPGTAAAAELECVQRALHRAGMNPVIAGFYAFGEVAPALTGSVTDPHVGALTGKSAFHNETMVAVLIGQ